MADNKYLKAGIGYTVGNYLLKGLTFLTMPIFARLLSKEDYGQYNIFVTYEAMMFVILGMAIHASYKNAYYKYSSKDGKDHSEYNVFVSDTMVLLLISTGLWLVITIALNKPLGKLLGIDGICLPLLILFSYSSAVTNCFNADVGIRYEYGRFLKVSFANAFGNIALSLILILTIFNNQRYLGRIIGCTLPAAFISIYIAFKYLRKAKPAELKNKLKWGIRYSLPIVPHGLSQIVLNQFDRIMILHMIGSAAAGVYSFAYNIYMIISVTAASVDNVWSPWLYERMNDRQYDKIRKVSCTYLLFLLSIVIVVTQASPELILLLGGKKYAESVYCVIPIATSGLFAFAYNIPASVEYYRERTGGIAAATAVAALVNIVLNYYFINSYGYIAAAYTTLFTYILYFCFHLFMAFRIEKKMLFDTKTILAVSVIALMNNFAALYFINTIAIRYAIIGASAIMFALYEERELGLLGKAIAKRRTR